MFNLSLNLDSEKYYQLEVDLHLWKCQDDLRSESHGNKEQIVPDKQPEDQTATPTVHYLEKLIGKNLAEPVQEFLRAFVGEDEFTDEAEDTPLSGPLPDLQDKCEHFSQFQYQIDVSLAKTVNWTVFLLAWLLCIILVTLVLLKLKKFCLSRRKNVTEKHEDECLKNDICGVDDIPLSSSSSRRPSLQGPFSRLKNAPISLLSQAYSSPNKTGCMRNVCTTAEFLQNTTDYLFCRIDKQLHVVKEPSPAETGEVLAAPSTSTSTPRLARRPMSRRARMGSSPALTDVSEMMNDNACRMAWDELDRFSSGMSWVKPEMRKLKDEINDAAVKKLLQFYNRLCPVKSEQWNVASLLVNYVLMLLKKELEGITIANGSRFLDFRSTGSAKLGTKISKANQFDVHFLIHLGPNVLSEAVDHTTFNHVQQGKLVLCVKDNHGCHSSRKTFKSMNINSSSRVCLSSKEMLSASQEMVDIALQNLYTKTRSLLDRLPFQIKRAATPNLVLSLDTKSIIGLGLQEIKICLIPAIPLKVFGWFQPAHIYAVPPTESLEHKQRTEMRSNIPPEFLWNLSYGELQEVYWNGIQDQMKCAGTQSCHMTCLQILEALLTAGTKNNLLNRGEVTPNVLSTVMSYLLLESSPKHWSYENLANRFSDCIHFLRSAFQHGRLPEFFFNNPHLIEKMPFLQLLPMLCRGKQENLFAELTSEHCEKHLRFIEQILSDTGLKESVREEYSEEMWEYEFFVYN